MKSDSPSARRTTFASTTVGSLCAKRLWAVLNGTAVQLFLIAALSLAIYLFAFVKPYSLLQWWPYPHLDIGKMTRWDWRAGFAYLLAMLTLFGLYWLASRLVIGRRGAWAWGVVIGGAVAFSVALLFLYPVDAVDIFDYIIRGRMQDFYGANPFYQTPNGFKQDLFYPYAGWYTITSAYGPGWELLNRALALLPGNNVVTGVLVYKLLNLVAFAGTALLIGLVLGRYAPERALYGVLLFAWNPLVLYTAVGNGHNDIVMVFFVMLGFFLMARGNFTSAMVAETAGALIKFIPILLLPVILLAALKRIRDWRARLSFLLLTTGVCLLLITGSILPYWHGGDMISVTRRSEMFTTSLPTWTVIALERLGHLIPLTAEMLASRVALVLLAAWVVRELWILWRKVPDLETTEIMDGKRQEADWQPYVHAALSILMFYLLVSCLWFQSWYAVWPVALAALLPESLTAHGAILLSLVATWKMPIFDFYIFRGGRLPPFQTRELPLTAGTFGAVWFYFLYRWNQLQSKLQPDSPPAGSIQKRRNSTE